MHSYTLHLLLTIFIFPTIPISGDILLLNSGDSTTSTDTTGRTWDADNDGSRYPAAISSSATASFMDSSVFQVPYKTARVFRSHFTYTFPVAVAGPKFLRLYFYPTAYSDFDTSECFFSLTANDFTLLTNFSAFLHSQSSGKRSFMKEFVINVNATLDLTFSPNPDSFAFINGIEIVSIPDNLYYGGKYYIKVDGSQLAHLETTTAMENLYRLNVGGAGIQDDGSGGGGMFRFWSPDDDYIYFADRGWTVNQEVVQIKYTADTPPYSAPAIVYSSGREMAKYSISLEWGFPVDSGFFYLLRLHFCEFVPYSKQNQRVFTIKINEQTVEIDMDVIRDAGGPEIPMYRDYITWVPDDGRRGKRDLRLSLFPYVKGRPQYHDALLNGLEIFRLSDSNRSLAEPNPELVSGPSPAKTMPPSKNMNRKGEGYFLTYAVTGGIVGVLAVAAMIFLIFRRWRKLKNTAGTGKSWELLSSFGKKRPNTLPSDLCRYFSLDQMRAATGNFDGDLVVGRGGFGNVYKGFIDDGTTVVAVKRLNRLSNQGLREFSTEIEMLSKLRHHNLVSLIGYCSESGEMILVYEYMAHGTLRDHLRSSDNPPLKWEQRLKICLGAARGLHHLHTGAGRAAVIHRDIKTANILLDENWAAKVCDFGLSKVGPAGGAEGHVSTAVKGSFGYIDPEYYRRRQLTEKSDVYSFGVVMLEVLCGRPAVDASLPYEQANLAAWARLCYEEGTLEKIVDSDLDGQISPECFETFAETAAACVRDKGIERPAMSDVVWSLEFALQLQEMSVESSEGGSAVEVEISSTHA